MMRGQPASGRWSRSSFAFLRDFASSVESLDLICMRVWGLGIRVSSLGSGVWGLGFRV